MMASILNIIKKKCEIILGWIEVNLKPAFKSATNLNKLSLFSLFRPDHAQMIVFIATVESLLSISTNDEIIKKYMNYINLCNLKLSGKQI